MKTRKEVDKLKEKWAYDPIWDIEDTEGFEEYRDELKIFRLEKEIRDKAINNALTANEGHKIYGISGNLKLIRKLRFMEDRIDQLNEEIEKLKNSQPG